MAEIAKIDINVHFQIHDDFLMSDIVSVAKKIKTNCLVITGKKDEVATLRSVKKLAGVIKNATLRVMEKTGHLLPIEHPQKTATIITNWLKKLT